MNETHRARDAPSTESQGSISIDGLLAAADTLRQGTCDGGHNRPRRGLGGNEDGVERVRRPERVARGAGARVRVGVHAGERRRGGRDRERDRERGLGLGLSRRHRSIVGRRRYSEAGRLVVVVGGQGGGQGGPAAAEIERWKEKIVEVPASAS